MESASSTENEIKKDKQIPPAFLVAVAIFLLAVAAGPLPR